MSAPGEAELELSIVVTLYRSSAYVRDFYARAVKAAEAVTTSFELVFIDDGSPDDSAAIVREFGARDPRVVLVELSRNFGHHEAALAGLATARGARIFIIDADLEEQPEWLGEFWTELNATGADVVFGVNDLRQGSPLRRIGGALFWRIFNALSNTQLPLDPCTVRLMERRYVDALLQLPERNVFLAGNYAWLGFEQVARHVRKAARREPSSYSVARLVGLFVEALTSYSAYPLQVIFFVGLLIAFVAVAAGAWLVVQKVLYPETILMGWPSLIVSIWFLGGVNICFIGIVGTYLSKVFVEVKQRPIYVIRRLERFPAPEVP